MKQKKIYLLVILVVCSVLSACGPIPTAPVVKRCLLNEQKVPFITQKGDTVFIIVSTCN